MSHCPGGGGLGGRENNWWSSGEACHSHQKVVLWMTVDWIRRLLPTIGSPRTVCGQIVHVHSSLRFWDVRKVVARVATINAPNGFVNFIIQHFLLTFYNQEANVLTLMKWTLSDANTLLMLINRSKQLFKFALKTLTNNLENVRDCPWCRPSWETPLISHRRVINHIRVDISRYNSVRFNRPVGETFNFWEQWSCLLSRMLWRKSWSYNERVK